MEQLTGQMLESRTIYDIREAVPMGLNDMLGKQQAEIATPSPLGRRGYAVSFAPGASEARLTYLRFRLHFDPPSVTNLTVFADVPGRATSGGRFVLILPEGMVCATSIANRDLPGHYAGQLFLLTDHWDSMHDNGFLSKQLFDGGAMGTPVITDPVAGLAEVFGDSVATAATADEFTGPVRAALADPAPWLARAARARDIVLAAHTFDRRAATLAALIERLAAVKEGA